MYVKTVDLFYLIDDKMNELKKFLYWLTCSDVICKVTCK